jgi:hypothetical protein
MDEIPRGLPRVVIPAKAGIQNSKNLDVRASPGLMTSDTPLHGGMVYFVGVLTMVLPTETMQLMQ